MPFSGCDLKFYDQKVATLCFNEKLPAYYLCFSLSKGDAFDEVLLMCIVSG